MGAGESMVQLRLGDYFVDDDEYQRLLEFRLVIGDGESGYGLFFNVGELPRWSLGYGEIVQEI